MTRRERSNALAPRRPHGPDCSPRQYASGLCWDCGNRVPAPGAPKKEKR